MADNYLHAGVTGTGGRFRAPILHRKAGFDQVKAGSRLSDASGMPEEYTGPDRRQSQPDRRAERVDRRSGMDRRRGPGRRRGEVRRAAEEGEISGELLEFILAIDEYKRINERPFPSWSEVFEIIHYLGYRKVAEMADHINRASGAEVLEEKLTEQPTSA